MEQYIPKSTLVAWIVRRVKEIDETGTYLSPRGVLTNLLCHLDTIEVKEADLTSNLKEAAEEYSPYNLNIDKEHEYGQFYHSIKTQAFKAGAEWMANQGTTFNGEIISEGLPPYKQLKAVAIVDNRYYKHGDKVIVQIRKYEKDYSTNTNHLNYGGM